MKRNNFQLISILFCLLIAGIPVFSKTIESDILIYGDEIPAIASAIMASRGTENKAKILIIRPNKKNELLGGLITRGQLAYLDRNQILESNNSNSLINKIYRFLSRIINRVFKIKIPNHESNFKASSCFYQEFLDKSKVKKIAINPNNANLALLKMINENKNIRIISETILTPIIKRNTKLNINEIDYLESNSKERFKAKFYIDGTQNADLARKTGLKYSIGFETLGFPKATLPITPVFQTKGLSIWRLQEFERSILNNKKLLSQIKKMVRNHNEPKVADWLLSTLKKEMIIGEDYIDIRSIAIGASYHLYTEKPFNLKTGFLFDRANIAILGNDNLSWNAFLYKMNASELMDFIKNGIEPRDYMQNDMQDFGKWLNSNVHDSHNQIKIIPPSELYIRHSLNILDVKKVLSGQEILKGKNQMNQAVGTFSYYFDVRGGIDGLSGKMPKPIFDFGIDHSITKIRNLAVVGRSAGYYGLAPAIGRILELNISIGAHIGLANAICLLENRELQDINGIETKTLMEKLYRKTAFLEGKNVTATINKETLSKII